MKKEKISSISHKYPTYRDLPVKSVYKWLDGKKLDDRAEGLWRIHDSLYDLTNFIDKHPGGKDWLILTKGTDITEAFESHHIATNVENILPKFKVRDAKEPRNIKLTFKENGFYRTLKSRIRDELPKVDRSPERMTKIIQDSLLALTLVFSILTAYTQSYFLAILTGLFLTWTTISSHNFFHRRDNWRMLPFNLSLMSYREWRISHAISHHLYTNSLHDLEISMFEPFLCWLPDPNRKNLMQRYGSWVYGPIIYFVLYFAEFVKRISTTFTKNNHFYKDDFIPFILPLLMFTFGTHNLWIAVKMWLFIVASGSFIFSLIGLNAAHHHPKIIHDGDTLRDGLDWGIYQLDTVMDRIDLKGSQFLVQTHFGEHALHHLFPTLDHGILPQLNDILVKTCKDFEAELKECSWLHHIIGQHIQLARIETTKVYQGKKQS